MFLSSLISASRRIPFTVLFCFSDKLLRRLGPLSRPHLQIQVSSNPSSNAQRLPSPPIPAFPSTATNAFLFARLELSLAAAMFATLVQEWVRRYLRLTQPRYSPHRRSRIRACIMKERSSLPELQRTAQHTFLHLSIVLFLLGLVMLTSNGDLVAVGLYIALPLILYLKYSMMPYFDPKVYTPPPLSCFRLSLKAILFSALTIQNDYASW
ncbi:hypothetical protein BJV74DRAFT_213114 [Russula compacta]|nr:hypothetical protein BJV74DRAFT_213114 [Russula compacta]